MSCPAKAPVTGCKNSLACRHSGLTEGCCGFRNSVLLDSVGVVLLDLQYCHAYNLLVVALLRARLTAFFVASLTEDAPEDITTTGPDTRLNMLTSAILRVAKEDVQMGTATAFNISRHLPKDTNWQSKNLLNTSATLLKQSRDSSHQVRARPPQKR